MLKLAIPLSCLLLTASFAIADTITLNTGVTYEGTVVSETETEVVFSRPVSAGIIDQQTFPKTDIKELKRTPQDQLLYERIKDFKVGADSLAPAEYERRIGVIETFLSRYPESQHTETLKKNLAALKAEAERTGNGEIKWGNRWLDADAAEEYRYQIAGHRYFTRMQEQVRRKDLVGALNTFAQIERSYPGAIVFPDAVALTLQVIPALSAQVDQTMSAFHLQEKQYKEGIDYVLEPERSRMIAARAAQARAADEAAKAAAALKWKPLIPQIEQSSTDLKALCENELKRLRALPIAAMRQSVTASEEAEKALAANNAELVSTKVQEAKAQWPTNELASLVERKAQAALEAAKAKAEAEAEAAKAEPVVEPAPAGEATPPAQPAKRDAEPKGEGKA